MYVTMRTKLLGAMTVLAALALAPAALAETDTTQLTVNAGTLDYTTPFSAGNFPTTTLTGTPLSLHADANQWVVTDARGSVDNGWNVTIAASQFSAGGGKTLPLGSLALTAPPNASSDAGNSSAAPSSLTPGSPIDDGSTQKLASAAAGDGLGQWTFGSSGNALTLTVPSNTQTGTYVSTITTTLATGP
jgi:WxL domain surface cell wall-binding